MQVNHELKAVCGLPRAKGYGGFQSKKTCGHPLPERLSRLPHAEFVYMQAFI